MPISVTLDTITEADLEATRNASRRIRTGYVRNIGVDSTPDPLVLEKAYDWLLANGFPFGSYYAPTVTTRILTNIRLKGIPGYIDTLRLYLTYESIDFGGVPSAYIVRNRSSSVEIETTYLPGTRQPLKVGWKGTAPTGLFGTPTGEDAPSIDADFVPMRIAFPMRQISVSALVRGTMDLGIGASFSSLGGDGGGGGFPPLTGSSGNTNQIEQSRADCVTFVNDSTWLGKPKGYWRLDAYENDISKYDGYYTVDAVASTLTVQDWSIFSTLFNHHIGKYVKIDDSVQQQMAQDEYDYGIINPQNDSGIIHVGPYRLTNFRSLFGFG